MRVQKSSSHLTFCGGLWLFSNSPREQSFAPLFSRRISFVVIFVLLFCPSAERGVETFPSFIPPWIERRLLGLRRRRRPLKCRIINLTAAQRGQRVGGGRGELLQLLLLKLLPSTMMLLLLVLLLHELFLMSIYEYRVAQKQ